MYNDEDDDYGDEFVDLTDLQNELDGFQTHNP